MTRIQSGFFLWINTEINQHTMDIKAIFKSILSVLNKIFHFVFKDITTFLACLFGILAIMFFIQMKVSTHRLNNTIREKSDTIEVYQNKNKELYAMTEMQISDISNLKEANDELYQEVKSLKDNPLVITRTVTETKIDSIQIISEVYIDTVNKKFNYDLKYSDSWCDISGYSNVDLSTRTANTMFESISFNDTIFVDIIEKKGDLYLISKSLSPYASINNQESIMLSPEKIKTLKKRFNKRWGVNVGPGISLGLKDNTVILIPAISLNVGYQVIGF